jgi:hypothetical protein
LEFILEQRKKHGEQNMKSDKCDEKKQRPTTVQPVDESTVGLQQEEQRA